MTKLKDCIQSAPGPTHIPDYRQILVKFTSEHTGSACLKRLVLAPVDLSTRQAIQELRVTAIVVYGLRIVPEDRTVQIPGPGRFLIFHTDSREGSLCRAEEAYPHTLPRNDGIVATGEHPQT